MFLALPFKLAFSNKMKEEPKYDFISNDSQKKKEYSIILLIFPSMCDVFATILDCIGLIFVIFYLFKSKSCVDTCFCSSNVKRIYGYIHMFV